MSNGFQEYLVDWFQTPENQVFYAQEMQLLNRCLPNLFGFHLVQLGRISNENICLASRVNHKTLVDHTIPPLDVSFLGMNKVQADLDFLPIAKDCVDVVLLPHTLEVAADPHYLLRQVDAMLLPEGHLVISGFSPAGYLSWAQGWRVSRLRAKLNQEHGCNVYLQSPQKLKEWLEVLGYDVQKLHFTSVGAVIDSQGLMANVVSSIYRFVNKLLKPFKISLGNSYCLVAKKRVDSPTLVGLKWQMPRWKAVSGNLAQSRVSSTSSKNTHYKNYKKQKNL